MSNIQLVVFDIAGTTVSDNGQVADAFIAAFRTADVKLPVEEVKRVMGFRKIDAVRQLLDKFSPDTPSGEERESLITEIHDRFIRGMISFYRQDPDLRPLPHAEELFSRLHRKGIKQFVGKNNPRYRAHIGTTTNRGSSRRYNPFRVGSVRPFIPG